MANHGLMTSSCILHRYMSILILVFYACGLYAQKNLDQQLNDILISKDVEACKKLLSQISQTDIIQMADSILFDYYYLAGWYALENGQTKESFNNLVKAKELCETKIGIEKYASVYFELIKALGENCEDTKKIDEALLWYEEGLVKALPYLNSKNETLISYIRAIRNNAANLFEKKGYPDMARYVRSEKPLNYEGSFDYACDLLNQSMSLNDENKGEEAIALLDKAYDIFRECGEDGKRMMQPLYRYYLLSYAYVGDTKQIEKLLKSKKRLMYRQGEDSYFVSDMGEVVAIFLLNHHDIKTAQKYYQYILEEYNKSNQSDANSVEHLGKNLQFFVRTYAQIDSLDQVRKSCVTKDYTWGVTSLQLANLMIKIQRYEDGNRISEEIYPVSSKFHEDPDNLHWFVLMNLADYNILRKNEPKAEQYLKEQLNWLDAHNFASNDVERGWVYNKLGIAYMNSGKYEECDKMLMTAEDIILSSYSKESLEYATILHNKGRLAQLRGNYEEAKKILTEAQRLQITISGKPLDKTEQYLNEVEHAIKVQL